ncbi:MAG: hypothetical protein KME26_29025 [Oscillatoria princeps RMCB-10]|jgi:hypothetical protein|nr:hypothetical protein [Oscillatoria princeps RMCB-10]
MNGCDGIVERRDKPLSLQEFCNKDATGLDISCQLACRAPFISPAGYSAGARSGAAIMAEPLFYKACELRKKLRVQIVKIYLN